MVAPVSDGAVVGTVGGLAPLVTVVTGTVVVGAVVVATGVVVVEFPGGGGGGGNVGVVLVDSGVVVVEAIVVVVVGAVVVEAMVVVVVGAVVVEAMVVVVVGAVVVVGHVVVVVGLQHLTVVVVFHVVEVTGLVVVVPHQFQFHVVVVSPPWWRECSTTLDFTDFVVEQVPKPTLLLLWLVDALDVRAGSAIRLSATTAIAANADRELLSNRVVVARHIPTNCRKVNA